MKNMNEVVTYPKIAVLLAAHNGKKWLLNQLKSILNQQDVSVVVFVSVDVSNDGTENLFNQLANNDNRIKILPHGFYFGSAAPNFFRLICDVDVHLFDYVCFSDQDDIWFSNKLKCAVEQLSQHDADGYSCNVLAFWSSGKKKLICKSQTLKKWDYLFESAGPGCTYVINNKLMCAIKNCVIYNRVDIQSVSLHDWFCYAYARANNYSWYIDPQPYVFYRQHSSNQVGANVGIYAFIYRFNMIFSGYGINQSVLIASLVGLSNSSFVRLWSQCTRIGFLRLSFAARECRRKYTDQFLFFCACILMVVFRKG